MKVHPIVLRNVVVGAAGGGSSVVGAAGSGVGLTVDDCIACWASQGPAVSREELAAQLVLSRKRRKVGETAVVPATATR